MRRPSWRVIAAWAGFATAIGLVQFGYRYLDVLARGRTEPFAVKLIEELSAAYGVALLVPLVAWWTRRVHDGRGGKARWLWHVPGLVVFSFLHTSWMATVRPVAFGVAGLGRYDYGIMPIRYAMEFGIHIIAYGVIVAGVALLDHRRRLREQRTRLVQAEAELNAAKLRALEARLHPHFLFNALNTISSVMYEDVRAADRMIAKLSELLRRALRDDASLVSLGEELDTLELWTDVMRARFGERLDLRVDAAADVRKALVPPLVLQPLVENAVKHGDPGAGKVARISVRAVRENGNLVLQVADNGPGLRVSETEALDGGVGLSTTRKRLERMYDGAPRIALRPGTSGGLTVSVTIPWQEGERG